jgi:NAD(P)-dependent dehydrogenase (short-subunit alcohol dehydrogenase family)
MPVVLVTGGSSGIGLATVRRLAAAGDRVFAASRHPQCAALPEGVTAVTLDVVDPVAVEEAVTSVVDAAGRLDVLVNNAGTGSLGSLEETGDEEARRILDVNLLGPLRLARSVVPVMRAQGGGRIVNVTSMNDVLPAPFGGWYSASKAALASASAVLDAEVHGFGIFVTVVAPGFFRTAMAEALESFDVGEESPYRPALVALAQQNASRLETAGDPDDVAAAIESCIRAAEPPARLVVGADAHAMERLVRQTVPNDFAELLRAFVADLASGRPTRRRSPPGTRRSS